MSLLCARDLTVHLGGKPVVSGATLALDAGKLVALVGPNGAGKTTLVRALAGLLPSEGVITVGERPLAALSAAERAKHIAYLPQGHAFHWPVTAEAVVALGRYPHADLFSRISPDDGEAVRRAMAATGTEALAARIVTTLSGGERARVALARALATQAPVLLADEPTAALDPRHQLVVMELLRRAARDGGTVLAIVHDLTLAARFADRVVVMDRGRIAADDVPETALSGDVLARLFGVEAQIVESAGRRVPLPQRPV